MADDVATRVQVLAPADGEATLAQVLALPGSPGQPFAAPRRQTLAELSRRILTDPSLRSDPAAVALGYWLRRSNIDAMAQAFERRQQASPNTVFVPAGRVFHVAPGNVDTVFVYSWALSYLCGNQNIVRVSGRTSQVLAQLLDALSTQMQTDSELAGGNRFLTYEHDREVSEALSNWATHRVIWGGDETVAELRLLPLSPHASERTFGSKFSYSVMSLPAYCNASPETVEKLAAGFFNDVFMFEQMACSSPHLLVWVGSPGLLDAAQTRFHAALAQEIERRGYRGQPGNAIHRLNFVFDLACDVPLRANLHDREFLAVRLSEGAPVTKEICGAGLLSETRIDELPQLLEFAQPHDQTVTHFGFDESELREIAQQAGARGVDRFVPVGEALAFDTTWDGYDLISDFLRQVTVRMGPT